MFVKWGPLGQLTARYFRGFNSDLKKFCEGGGAGKKSKLEGVGEHHVGGKLQAHLGSKLVAGRRKSVGGENGAGGKGKGKGEGLYVRDGDE